MSRPIITLTTDFGHSDHFVGTVKGVILGILPSAEIVDITHEIAPFAITEAAFVVAQAYSYFPRRTVHVVVVDPGVGTTRRPILAEAAGQYFVAPDNGVLSMVFAREEHKARHVTAAGYFLPQPSNTFHARDIFAPVAAHLGRGVAPSKFGRLIRDHQRLDFARPVRTGEGRWSGTVLKVDRFGNVITSFRPGELPELQHKTFRIVTRTWSVERLVRSYAEGAPGELVVVEGSAGYLEVVSNQASAARNLGIAAGEPLELVLV